MKKIVLVLFAVLFSVASYAQQGEKSLGVNLGYGTELKTFKMGLNFNYCVTDAVELAPSFDYFFKTDEVSQWAVNMDVHYLFRFTDEFRFYPLFGLTLTNFHIHGAVGDIIEAFGVDRNYTRFGANIGAGVKYEIADNIDLGFELKYQAIKNYGQAVFGISIAYKF